MTSLFDWTKTSFGDVDAAENCAQLRSHLTRMAVEPDAIKSALHGLSEPAAGSRILDVGCGAGADVLALAERVGARGRVVGVDISERLVREGVAQSEGSALPIEFQVADAHELPFDDATFDAVRSERLFTHLPDPDRALREMIRVTRPGGHLLVADVDHRMWVLDHPDRDLTRTLLLWWFDVIASPWNARGMRRRLAGAGLEEVRVRVLPVVLYSLESADAMTGISRAATAAAGQGVISESERRDFDEELAFRDQAGHFVMWGTMIATTARRPRG